MIGITAGWFSVRGSNLEISTLILASSRLLFRVNLTIRGLVLTFNVDY